MMGSVACRGTHISAEVTIRPRLMTWCASCRGKMHDEKRGDVEHRKSAMPFNHLCDHLHVNTS